MVRNIRHIEFLPRDGRIALFWDVGQEAISTALDFFEKSD
jgi:hypothetical protein